MIRFTLVLVLLIFLASVLQRYIPPIIWLKGAAILLAPAILFYGCLTLPFPQVLGLTFFTGLVNDLLTVPFAKESDFTIGTSILLILVPALIMHGFSSTFLRGRWLTNLLLAELAAILTPFLLLGQYAIISFERRAFFYNDVIMWRILGPGVIAIVISPCVFLVLAYLSDLVRYEPQLDRPRLG
jgi:hypothetical protein